MLTFSVVDARVLPTTVQFQYPMELDPLKGSGKFVKISSSELEKTYDDYTIGVNENGFMVTCNDVDVNCLDEDVFRKILEEMESFGAYDLSKEDKDVIANLYKPNVIVKNIPKKNVFGISLKAKILEFLGQIFCTHYEIIQECKGDWCSLKEYTSEECAGLE
jgi:hypothetical protein